MGMREQQSTQSVAFIQKANTLDCWIYLSKTIEVTPETERIIDFSLNRIYYMYVSQHEMNFIFGTIKYDYKILYTHFYTPQLRR